eukprot:CAMPEP_0185483652 /NCGR_PEP_ID=MMETSP1366-20130426/8714_1 /TAXON_ID=38817 /ORGANISM="Gephyrocapsa oceanica, Strain RCC1303" /LENGTH=110 /DNA_ID=CAMNT_0028091613 /DNA_START=135 /DNA_END=465 /DNA_ORIENTATION=-
MACVEVWRALRAPPVAASLRAAAGLWVALVACMAAGLARSAAAPTHLAALGPPGTSSMPSSLVPSTTAGAGTSATSSVFLRAWLRVVRTGARREVSPARPAAARKPKPIP